MSAPGTLAVISTQPRKLCCDIAPTSTNSLLGSAAIVRSITV
jgi:hypothetical protein